MSELVLNAAKLMNMLPGSDQEFAYEFIKKLVLAWDPDFTKVTPEEKEQIDLAEKSGFISEDEIDWDNLSSYDL